MATCATSSARQKPGMTLPRIAGAAWWRRQPEAKKRINAEHKAIISALRKFDVDKLVEICATHRTGGHERSLSSGHW